MALSNLVVTDFTAPEFVKNGQTISLAWTVENQGSEATTSELNYWYDRIVYSIDDIVGNEDDVYLTDFYIPEYASLPLDVNSNYTIDLNITVPNDLTVSGYLLVKTDFYNNQIETDETDNVRSVAINVTAPEDNLVVTNFTAPADAVAGQTISLSWTVENQGTDATTFNYWYDTIFYSTDDVFGNEDDVYLTDVYTPYYASLPLDANGNYTINLDITVPDYLTGQGYLFVKTDFYNNQIETDETDNYNSVPINITYPEYNLVVTNFTAPADAVAGQTISLSWTVENQGPDATTFNYWYDTIFYSTDDVFGNEDDVYLTDVYTPYYASLPLDANGNYTINLDITVPDYLTGQGYLFVKTDFYNNQIETDETDNVSSVAFSVIPPDINLVVTDIVAPSSATNGQYISLSWTVENQGTTATTSYSWYDRIFYSTDDVFGNSDDVYLNEVFAYSSNANLPLDANETYTLTSNVTLPSNLAGSGYLFVKTDWYKEQIETDETDNVYSVPITFSGPNLVVTNATAPTAVNTGQTVSLSWTVQNQGDAATTASSWYDRVVFSQDTIFGNSDDIYIRETSISSYANLPLDPNETYTVTQNFTLPNNIGGSGYLLFKTDNYNYQLETNEQDNVYSLPIDVTAPNLVISNPTPPPTSAILGETIAVSWLVTNTGTVSANADWYDAVYVSNDDKFDNSDIYLTDIWTVSNTPLAPNASYTINRNITLPASAGVGNRYLLFVTDYYNNYQGETSETDNVVATPITLSAPDVVVTAATAPETGVARGSVNVSWTVKNEGTVQAAADWSDYVYLSTDDIFGNFNDTLIISQSIASQTPLAANGSYTINRSITLPNVTAGNYYLLFKADGSNNQGETNENNNVRAVPITVNVPDLVVSAATAPTNGIANGSIAVAYTVKNEGTVGSQTNWYDYVYLSTDATYSNSDTYITAQYISTPSSLGAGESYTKNFNLTLPNSPAGDYYLLFMADRDNYQRETNENNNVRAVPITIGVPDLTVSEATAPTSGVLGETINVAWTVTNSGTVTAPADWTDRVYFSANNIWDNADTVVTSESITSQTPLTAGSSYTINRSFTLPNQASAVGSGYLLFVADASASQAESSENNNVKAVAFTLNAPNLVVTNATAQSSVAIGDSLALSWTVANQGSVAANADWYDSVYISNDGTFDSGDEYLTSRWAGADTPIAAGGTYTGSLNVTLPSTTTGDRYLLFVADKYPNYYFYDNVQGETNESDNVYAVPINISAADLTIDAVTAPSQAIAGQTVALSWTVKNQGTGQASQDWYDYVYLSTNNTLDGSDTLLSSELIAAQTPIAAGDSYTISKNVTLSSNIIGQRYLIFAADGSGNQGETNENNNTQVVAINFTAPDLIVSDATVPTSANLGDSVAVSWTVTNQSTTDAPTDWSDYVYLSNDNVLDAADTLIATESISSQTPLAAGNIYTINRNINLTNNTATGNRYLLFVADGSQTQGETYNTNNVRAVPITLNAPDLVVTNITAPVEVISGQPLEIAWTDKNQGNTAATGTWYDYVYLQNQNSGQNYSIGTFEFTGTLAAGASIDRTQTINIPIQLQGNYRVVVTTDYYGNIAEGTQNESNNTTVDDRSIEVKLAPIPNLQVSSVTAPPTAFSSQGTVVEWTVTNTGNGSTSSPYWNDVVYLSLDNTYDNTDVYLGQASNPSYLNAGDSYTNSLNVTLPRGISGNYYFLVTTDVNNNVFENNLEGDNFGFGGPTNVSLTPPPDFQVTNVTTPSQGFSGQPLNISWTVANKGQGKNLETNWYDQVFMSADDVLDAGDRNLGTFYRSGTLNSNSSYTTSQTVNLPIGVSGDYFFFVRTDAGNQVYENVFESNNTGYKTPATRINLTPPPDLEIDSINAPSQATASRPLTFTYQVTNYGATTTPNISWTDTFYLSGDNQLDVNADLSLGSQPRYGSLAPDGSYSNTVSFTLPNTITGNYYLFAVTDSSNEVFELDNNNNTAFASTPITITSKPADLVVGSATAPTTAEAGKAIRVEWTVRNQGTGDTVVNSWTDNVILSADSQVGNGDDITLGSFSRSGLLNPNGSYTRSELVTLPIETVGQYRVFVVTDAGNGVYEASNENNNASTGQPLTVTRQTPDLQVTQVSSPTSGQSGQALTVNWTVQNFGTNRTNSNYWYDGVYLSTDNQISGDDIFLGHVYHSGALNAAEQYSVSRSFNLPANLQGKYYTIVKTDVYNYVFEASLENNNDKATEGITEGNGTTGGTTIGLTATPDLVIDTVDAPATGISGQNLSINWTVRNTGSVETGQRSWYEAFYLSRDQVFDRNTDTYLGYSSYNGNLGAGATYSKTESFRIPQGISGPLYVFAVTDAGNSVYERDGENNNVAYDGNSVAVTLSQPADLVVGTITIPANGVPGQNATISYTVNNQGQNPALGSWSDSIYISADNQWDVNDALFGKVQHFGDVASGGSYTETLTAALPGLLPGNYYAIVRSDIRNQIPESNENNNITASLNQFAADAERLDLGTADTGALGQGQAAYYRVDVAAGETLRVKFDSASTTAANELYIRYGDVPSRSQYDFGFNNSLSPDQDIVVPVTKAGTYYILAFGQQVSSASNNDYEIKAETLEFSLIQSQPPQIGNQGLVTLKIQGAKLTPSTSFYIEDTNGVSVRASQVFLTDTSTAYITFDLDGITPGAYSIRAEKSTGETATLSSPIDIVLGSGPDAVVDLSGPSSVRPARLNQMNLLYGNAGDADLPAPLFIIRTSSATPFGLDSKLLGTQALQIFGISDDGPANIIRPGSSFSRPLFYSSSTATVNFAVNSITVNDSRPIDWDLLRDSIRPSGLSNDEWNNRFNQLQSFIGTTWGDYVQKLNDAAQRLAARGKVTDDVDELFELIYQQATGENISFIGGTLTDPNTGIPIKSAVVLLEQLDTSNPIRDSVRTNEDGNFRFERLAPGNYRLRVAGSLTEGVQLSISDGQDVRNLALQAEIVSTGNLFKGLPPSDEAYSLTVDLENIRHTLVVQDGIIASSFFDENTETWTNPIAIPGAIGTRPQLRAFSSTTDETSSLMAIWRNPNNSFSYSVGTRNSNSSNYQWTTATTIPEQPVSSNGLFPLARIFIANDGTPAISWISFEEEANTEFLTTWTGTEWNTPIEVNSSLQSQSQPQPLAFRTLANLITPLNESTAPNQPAPIPADGSLDYYKQRYEDFVRRNPGITPPDYYLDYGDKYVNRFTNELRPILSPEGKVWLDQARKNLQQAIEEERVRNPQRFADLERNPDAFRDFAYNSHVKAYWDAGLKDLSITDLIKIGLTPDFDDLRTEAGLKQVQDIAQLLAEDKLNKIRDGLQDVADELPDSLKDNVNDYIDNVLDDFIDSTKNLIDDVIDGNLEDFLDAVDHFGEQIDQFVDDTAKFIDDIGDNLGNLDVNELIDDINDFADKADNFVDDIGDFVDHLGDFLDDFIDDIGDFIEDVIDDFVDNTKDFVEDIFDEIVDNFNDFIDDIIDDFDDFIDDYIPDVIFPRDPNDILGPAGFGEEKWLTASSTLPYTIRFENQASATAPAQQVVITQQLDPDLDFRTYRVGDFGWGDLFFDVPDNRAFYNERLDLTATKGFYVDVSAGIDVTTGEAFWTITTIDPNTGEIPEDALAGFLPPNNEDGVGDGFVNYSIRPKRNVETGAVIDAEARIVFDTEEPIDTPPIFNTIDAGTPSSTVNVLPATSQPGEFLVTWSGSDDSNGSALANYTIYVSDNGADFTPWLENTTLTEANYIGQAGHTYAFYSVARDNAGNIEAAPSTPDAETTIPGSTILSFGAATYSINEDGTPVTAVTINRDGSNGTLTATLTLANGTATAPADYDNTPITVNFADGETSKTVTIPIVNDAVAEGNETFTLSLGTSSDYQLGDISTATVTIIDNDTAGVTITQSGGSTNVTEGGATDSYTVVLTSQPTADVNITLGNTQTTTNVNTLNFTAANWNVAQTVTVTAIDDAVIEGNHTGVITHTASSSDTNYNSINIAAVNVNITDNDFNVITSSGRDPLTGTAANDRIVGGAGAKTITGGLGNDEFVYTNLRDVGHRIADFTVGEDKIVLTQLLSSIGYQGTNPINDGYVRLIQGSTANSTILQIDRDGTIGSGIFRNFLQLDNVTPTQMNSVDNFVF